VDHEQPCTPAECNNEEAVEDSGLPTAFIHTDEYKVPRRT
jgi:hypothetical protein